MDVSLTEATNAPNLDSYKRLFTEARDLTATAREKAKKWRRYYDGKLDEKLEKALRSKKQPTFNINRVRPGVEGMVGVVDRGKSDPRAYPRTPQDEASSEVATDTLRYVADINRWHQIKLASFRNMLIEGTAAVLTEVDEQLEVRFRRIRYEEFFYDPYSRELDYSDASYMGIAKWVYVDAVIAAYPEHEGALRLSVATGATGESMWDDRPENNSTSWTDPKRKRLLQVEMYHKHGADWLKCVFVGDLKLEEGISPYLDSEGKPCNPIEGIAAYIDDENNRYGVVADMAGPQDEINVYRRKAAHLATFRQFQETDPVSAYADKEEVKREGRDPEGVIPPGYGLVPNTDRFQMDMSLLQEAKSEIERASVNPSIVARGDSSSGRQDLIRQQAGLTELSHLFGGLEDWELRIFRQAWARVRQFWTEPKFIRVTDDENSFKFIQINEPVYGEPQSVWNGVQFVIERPVIEMRNAVAQMGVDIIIETTPDTANIQQETFKALADLARSGAFDPGNPAGKILIQASPLPKKRELLDMLKARDEQQPPPPDPRAEAAFDLEMRTKAAGIEKTTAQADQARAAAVKTMGEAQATEMQTRWMTAPQTGF
jgi:hypothetical protein